MKKRDTPTSFAKVSYQDVFTDDYWPVTVMRCPSEYAENSGAYWH